MELVDRTGAARKLQQAHEMLGRSDHRGAETAFREAIKLDSSSVGSAVGLAELLRGLGRPIESLTVLKPHLKRRRSDHGVLVEAAEAEKALGRTEAALELFRRAATDFPSSAVASHNLAGLLGDLSRFDEAEQRARTALGAGLAESPLTWLIMARALQGLGRLEESEAAYAKVLAFEPMHPDAWRELIQLRWMRTGDKVGAVKPLDEMMAARGADARLLEIRAVALKFCGDVAGARETIERALRLYPYDAPLWVFAAHLAILDGKPELGMAHAHEAVRIAPGFWTQLALCEALLANGDAAAAATLIEPLRSQAPNDQNVIAYQATAWRLLGDERYDILYDYDRFVSVQMLDTPPGWRRLEDYLSDLTVALEELHKGYAAHPFSQSVLNGSQVSNLVGSKNPVVRGFFAAVKEPIRRSVEVLGVGPDPLRSRNTFNIGFEGIWSVRLQGRSGGRHIGHVHTRGWLSSACYISLPPSMIDSSSQEGWLKFGEPGIATRPPLGSQHQVRPEPGLLALFPSYMWHGTDTFTGEASRLSVAFDLVPK